MNKKYIFLAAFIITLIIVFITWDDINVVEVSAEKLSADYIINKAKADELYLGKKLRIDGVVKAYYKILGARPVLELETNSDLPVFFFFLSQENETYGSQLQSGQRVVIKGKCVGVDEYSFVDGVKIEVDEFEER